jgi:hypothetical protein
MVNPVKYFGLPLALTVYSTVVTPLNILMGNYTEFSYGLFEILFESIPFFFLVFLIFIMPLLIPGSAWRNIYHHFLLFVLMVVVLTSEVLFGNYGAFDGRGISVDIYSRLSAAQILVIVLVFSGIFFSAIRPVFFVTSMVLILVNFTTTFVQFVKAEESFSKYPSDNYSKEFVTLSKNEPNYIYFLLDEVYGGSAEQIFTHNFELASQFEGFVSYSNTAGIYPTTIMSIPAILTNQLYEEGDDVKEFYQESLLHSALLDALQKNSIDYKLRTITTYCQVFSTQECTPAGSLGGGYTDVTSDYLRGLNLSIFKLMPDIFKAMVFNDGNWLFSDDADIDKFLGEFDYFVNNLAVRDRPSTFRFFHTVLTHAPIKYDENCLRMDENLRRTYENYLKQDTCGFAQVGRVLDRLRELGIYDNSFIIVSSDHGREFMSETMARKFHSGGIVSKKQYGHSHAMLMIKPLGSNGKLEVSEAKMSLLQVSPLIVSSIDDSPSTKVGARTYFHYDWSKEYHDWSKKTLPPFNGVFLIGEDITDPEDWSYDARYMSQVQSKKGLVPILCGKKIGFTPAKKTEVDGEFQRQDSYLSSGLSFGEAWGGRWSDGPAVSLTFRYDRGACAKARLLLKVSGLVTAEHRIQRSTVTLNNRTLGDIVIEYGQKNPQEIEFEIPEGVLTDRNLNNLHFSFENAISPTSLDMVRDNRSLALGFYEMTFL